MTPANPLVAAPVEMSTPLSGTFLLEDGEALVQAIESGDWVAGGMAAFAAVLDTVAAVSDPLGSLIAAGLGWVMEHLEPLKGWMNDLTGDAGEVAGFAATWTNVGGQLRASSAELSRVLADIEGMDGAAIQAYLAFQTETIKHLDAAGSWANAMATGLEIASTIVKIVHDIVRDAIAEIVGAVISYAAELVLTVGLATPLVVEQVTTRVASLTSRVGKSVTRLMTSGDALKGLLKSLKELFEKAGRLFDGVLKNEPSVHSPDVHNPKHTNLPDPPAHSGPRPPDMPDMSDINAKYTNSDGVIPPDKIDDWANEVSERYPTLTPADAKGIYDYTTGSYRDMNTYLRDLETPSDVGALESRINASSDGLAQLPPVPGVTSRGMGMTPDLLDQFEPGHPWKDDGFSSSSTNPSTAESFARSESLPGSGKEPAIITIDGKTAVDVSNISAFPNEAERLFQRGTEFDVISKVQDANGVWQIALAERVGSP